MGSDNDILPSEDDITLFKTEVISPEGWEAFIELWDLTKKLQEKGMSVSITPKD